MNVPSIELPERDAAALLVAVGDQTVERLTLPLRALGLEVRRAASSAEGQRLLQVENVAVVIARAEDASALAVLCEACPDVPIVVICPKDDQQLARNALAAGAVAIIGSDAREDEVRFALDGALRSVEASTSSEDPTPAPRRGGLLGDSEPMRRVAEIVGRTAPVIATALIRGETGTGKELVARALHDQSPRCAGPFVKVHCAALPEALLESELFGYEKGAFTGAASRKPGRVEVAEGGTLFLDEIGDITPATQVKLLRLLQDREYERLGGVRVLRADVRFVAATHRDLEGMVKRGDFREDLFYRLNVVTLWLPPLRARREDIPLLATEFAAEFSRTHGKPDARLDASAISALRGERWPGNVRQLRNFIERLVVLSTEPLITANDVRREMTAHVEFKTQLTGVVQSRRTATQAPVTDASPSSRAVSLDVAVQNAEREAIERALRHAQGNRTVAARILGISRATLYTKMETYGLERGDKR